MHYRKLSNTDIEVSVIAFGAWAIAGGNSWGEQDEAEAIAAMHAALDCGINFFDTAAAYGAGRSEELLGKALGDREEAIIATKYERLQAQPHEIRVSCETSLRRLRREVIDLYQIHWPNPDVPFADQIGALLKLREEGKVRWIGVCNCGVRDLEEVLACTAIASNQIPYSLLWRATEFEIIDRCVERSISVLCYSPLMQGLLTGKFDSLDDVPHGRRTTRLFSGEEPTTRHGGPGCITEAFAAVDRIRAICNRIDAPMARVALGWLLAQPGVASVLAGARSPAQVEQNAQAADLLLPPGILQELSDATAEVKQIMGAGPDPWQTESRSH